MPAPVVIIGASAAGISTAEALRERSSDVPIVLVGEEPDIAHDRPPLSKQVLQGAWDGARAELLPGPRRTRLGLDLRLGIRAVALDLASRCVRLGDGSSITYSELVIATGARPRMLPGEMPRGVFTMRTLADSEALRAALTTAGPARLAIVGGGLIGLEVAASARKLGVDVTVVEPYPALLTRRLGSACAERLLALHRDQGVQFRFGDPVDHLLVDGTGQAAGLRLASGASVDASVILVSIGCTPNTEWLEGSGLTLKDGVVCDEYCQAAPHVWVAGDVCRWRHLGYGEHVRLEQRMNASQQGAAVAENLLGARKPFSPVPFFWTDQYSARIQIAGRLEDGATEQVDAIKSDSFLHTFRVGGELCAVLGWNATPAMMPARKQLAERLGAAGQRVEAGSVR